MSFGVSEGRRNVPPSQGLWRDGELLSFGRRRFGDRSSDFRFQVSGFKFQVSGFGGSRSERGRSLRARHLATAADHRCGETVRRCWRLRERASCLPACAPGSAAHRVARLRFFGRVFRLSIVGGTEQRHNVRNGAHSGRTILTRFPQDFGGFPDPPQFNRNRGLPLTCDRRSYHDHKVLLASSFRSTSVGRKEGGVLPPSQGLWRDAEFRRRKGESFRRRLAYGVTRSFGGPPTPTSGFRFQVSGFGGLPTSGAADFGGGRFPTSGFKFQVSGLGGLPTSEGRRLPTSGFSL